MSEIWQEPWLWPAVAVTLGLPLLLIVTTEVAAVLERRGSPAAKVVRLVRNFVLPLGALLLLLAQVDDLGLEVNATKVTSTLFGFVLILALLNTLNIALFSSAERGSWRQRVPSIFVDLGRLIVVVLALAFLFSWVWGADVGGLFTALGVSSIIIGLALQNAAGSVVSGLLLLFEQPFQLGDWLETGTTRGRVVEVNWRAVHIDVGDGTQIVPTASLAGSSFINLSRSRDGSTAQTMVSYATDDAPFEVMALIRRVAHSLPGVAPDREAKVVYLGAAKYEVRIPVLSPADKEAASEVFLARLWYASRRAELHLDGDMTDDFRTPERLEAALRETASALSMGQDEAAALAPQCHLEQFGAGEVILDQGEVPEGMGFVLSGRVAAYLPQNAGATTLPLASLGRGEAVGLGAFTRQRSSYAYLARGEVALLVLPVSCVDQLVASNPRFATAIGKASDNRRAWAVDALERQTSKQ